MDETVSQKITNFKEAILGMSVNIKIQYVLPYVDNNTIYVTFMKLYDEHRFSSEDMYLAICEKLEIDPANFNEEDKNKLLRYADYFIELAQIEFNQPYEERLKNLKFQDNLDDEEVVE